MLLRPVSRIPPACGSTTRVTVQPGHLAGNQMTRTPTATASTAAAPTRTNGAVATGREECRPRDRNNSGVRTVRRQFVVAHGHICPQ